MHVSTKQAAELLNNGKVVGIPTETVYGLAASLNQPQAIEEVFRLKGRPSNNPLIVHLSSLEQLKEYVHDLSDEIVELAHNFWPGAMTLVLPIKDGSISDTVRARLSTAAFRIPNHPLTSSLLELTGPLVMPSANLSGRPSATSAAHVENDFGADFPVLNGGVCTQGLESTILFKKDERWVIIRLGALAPDAFKSILGYSPEVMGIEKNVDQPLCPGQLYRHYAPKAHLRLVTETGNWKGVVIGFDDRSYRGAERVIYLGSSGDPETAAHRLYGVLRQLDAEGISEAWVDTDFPSHGLWLTLKERLIKASN